MLLKTPKWDKEEHNFLLHEDRRKTDMNLYTNNEILSKQNQVGPHRMLKFQPLI